MSKKESKELMVPLTPEQEAILGSSYPVEQTISMKVLPRLGMYSQDKTEGKGKAMKVVGEAGTFFIESPKEVENEKTGKKEKAFIKEEIGTAVEVIIFYERRQLSYYDSDSNSYISSPVFEVTDPDNEPIIPLFQNKKEIDRGTPTELKAREDYQGKSAKGKDISKLEDIKILYVLYNGEIYQMNLRGTSMFAFRTYKKTVKINKVVTVITSEEKENGSINWNQMDFGMSRNISKNEADIIINHVKDMQAVIKAQADFYSKKNSNIKNLPKIESKKVKEDEDF